MSKNVQKSFPNHLGWAIKKYRLSKSMTQKAFLAWTKISLPTLRNIEKGKGYFSSFEQICNVHKLSIVGHNLPKGDYIYSRIYALRKAKQYTQQKLADLAW